MTTYFLEKIKQKSQAEGESPWKKKKTNPRN